MSSQPTPVVTAIGQLHFEGNIIPHTWYQHLRTANNTPHTTAIIILSEIIYWFRPVADRDEETGKLLGFHKKFRADMYQRSYDGYAAQFGFTKGRVKSAFDYLREKGLVRTEFRSFTSESGLYLSNVMYVEPIPEAIKRINLPLPEESEAYPQGGAAIPTPGMQLPPPQVCCPTQPEYAAGGTYTETPTEIPLETPTEIHTPPPAPKPASRATKPPNGGGRKPPAGMPKPTKVPKLSPEQEQVRNRLMHVFREESGLPGPQSFAQRNKAWHQPLAEIAGVCDWDEATAEELIRDTIGHMNKKGLDMKCPASIVNVALGIKRRKRGEADGFEGAWREL